MGKWRGALLVYPTQRAKVKANVLQMCRLHYPLYIGLQAADLNAEQKIDLSMRIESSLNSKPELSIYRFHVSGYDASKEYQQPANVSNNALVVMLDAASKTKNPKASLRSESPVLDVQYNLQSPNTVDALAAFLAQEISQVYDEESAALSYLLQDSTFSSSAQSHPLSPEKKMNLEGRTTRTFKYASAYHLTFSLFTPAASPSAWEIDEALKQYISPLLASLNTISEFTIDTQVQLFASFSPSIAGPTYDTADKRWKLKYEDLTGFINAAEWPLSPSIGSGPTINFVLYVPAPDKSPLVVANGGETSWLIPQWGGVKIHNPPSGQSNTLTLDDLRPDMITFVNQLTSLLGIPHSPTSLSLRISSLTRERATSVILSASSTLGALARLTLRLKYIAIPDSVAKSVDETLDRLDRACSDLHEGRFDSALANARVAEIEAEKAFFEPSMVGQVYFPEEHKVAVYVPLLGPMAVPLLMSGVKELRKLREKKVKAN